MIRKISLLLVFILIGTTCYAQPKTKKEVKKERKLKKVKYKASLNNDKDKIEYVYNIQSRLLQEHNQKGVDLANGVITQEQYDEYKKKFRDQQAAIAEGLSKHRKMLRESNRFTIDLDTVFEDKDAQTP